jgi:hypothetical protein
MHNQIMPLSYTSSSLRLQLRRWIGVWLMLALLCLPSLGVWHQLVHGHGYVHGQGYGHRVLAGSADLAPASVQVLPQQVTKSAQPADLMRQSFEALLKALFASHDDDSACLSFDQSTSQLGLTSAGASALLQPVLLTHFSATVTPWFALTHSHAQARAPPFSAS